MSIIKKRKRLFKSDLQVIRVRNSANRLRPATVTKDKSFNTSGRHYNLLPAANKSSFYQDLLKYVIIPLVNALDLGDEPLEKMSFADRIAFILGANHRDIVMAVAMSSFEMPGLMWQNNNPAEQISGGPIQHRILEGTPLMVRIDERTPERIDIERCDSETGTVFSLTKFEYEQIFQFLKEIAGKDERLNPPGSQNAAAV